MIPYFLLLSLPVVFSIFNQHRINRPSLLLVMFIFVAFVGLRFKVGTDWNNYLAIHQVVSSRPISEAFYDAEPAASALFWASWNLRGDMLLTNLVAAFILLGGVVSFARRTSQPWLAFLAASPYLVIVFGMTGVRQAMAVGVILFSLSQMQRHGMFVRSAFVVLASLFHTSALVNFVFIILAFRGRLVVRVLALLAFGALGLLLSSRLYLYSDNIAFYQDAYLSDEDSIVSPGALMHVALVWLPAIGYFMFRRRIDPYLHDRQLMMIGSTFALGLLIFYFFSSTGASRMTLYLYFVPMMFYPAFVHILGPRQKGLLIIGVCLFHLALLGVWLGFANNAAAHMPYRSVFYLE